MEAADKVKKEGGEASERDEEESEEGGEAKGSAPSGNASLGPPYSARWYCAVRQDGLVSPAVFLPHPKLDRTSRYLCKHGDGNGFM